MYIHVRPFSHPTSAIQRLIAFALASFLSMGNLLAQQQADARVAADSSSPAESKPAIGVTASLAAVQHMVPPSGVAGVPNCCSSFGNESSIGWDVALRYALPLSSLRLVVSAGVSHVGVSTEVTQEIGRVVVNGNVVPAVVTNQLTLNNTFATIGLGVEVPVVSDLQVWAAVNAGIPLQQIFSQNEKLNTPGAQFENGGSERNVIRDAEVGENSIMILPSVGLRYSVRVGTDWVVGPHVGIQTSPLSSSKRLDSWTWLSGVFGVLIERSL